MAGNEAGSRNAVTHGLTAIKTSIVVEGKEDSQAYEALHRDLREEYRPALIPEHWAVQQLGDAMWMVIRCKRAQVAAIEDAMRTGGRDISVVDVLRKAFGEKSKDPAVELGEIASGVAKLITLVTTFMDDMRGAAEEGAAFWAWVRQTAALLEAGVPGVALLVNAHDETITKPGALEIRRRQARVAGAGDQAQGAGG